MITKPNATSSLNLSPIVPLRKYVWVAITSMRANLAYLNEVFSRMIFLGVILFIFTQLWHVTYSQTGQDQLAGLSMPQMLWYLAITESIIMSSSTGGSSDVDQDVRTGSLAVQLIRPISYPLYRLSLTLGERFVRFSLNALVGSLIVFLLVGPIQLSLGGLLLFILTLPLAFTLDFLGVFLIGLCAFWLEDTSGILLIYRRIMMILGGMLIPLQLFPASWQAVLRILPFSSIVYGPAHMLIQPGWDDFISLIIRQGVAILIIAIVVTLVYRTGVKRINSNGG